MAHTLRCSANHATFLRAYLIERNLTVSRPVGFLLHGYQILMYSWYIFEKLFLEVKIKIKVISVEDYLFIKLKAI